jgi:hypothetical protein
VLQLSVVWAVIKGVPEIVEYQTKPAPTRLKHAHVWLLIAITLFGGFLRFFKLSQPALWGDEAWTYYRICGNYQQFLDILQFNGFVPLHYELYQWIRSGMPLGARIEQKPVEVFESQRGFFARRPATKPTLQPTSKPSLVAEYPIVSGGVRMTPIVMRLVPALAGTLMIPAMYFLAMQIAGRKVGLVTALLTACSAYMLVYSRDAKMYMHFWLFCTLSAGCFLWWLRVHTRISWLCWVASSLAMCGLHAPGLAILAIELVVYLSMLVTPSVLRRMNWKAPIFFVLGLAVILSGIGGYYWKFNRYKEKIDEGRNWDRDSLIGWVEGYNKGRDGVNMICYTAGAYLFSWEWATPQQEKWIAPRTLKLLHGAGYVTLGLLVLGLFPWRTRARLRSAVVSDSTTPLQLRVFWITTWIVLSAYVLYGISFGARSTLVKGVWTPGFVSPGSWFKFIGTSIAPFKWPLIGALVVVLLACFIISERTLGARLKKTIAIVAPLLILFALLEISYLLLNHYNRRTIEAGGSWHSLWMPRYLGFIWPAVAIAVATLLWRLPTRPLRFAALGFVLIVNLVQFATRVYESEPPTDAIARDMVEAAAPNRTYLLGIVSHGLSVRPGEGLYPSAAWRYYVAYMKDLKLTPMEFRTNFARTLLDFGPIVNRTPQSIARDLKNSPQIKHITVWDKIEVGRVDTNADDTLKAQLGKNWKRVDEKTFSAFDHWTWQKLYEVRRREYVKT